MSKVDGNKTGTWDGIIHIICNDKGKRMCVTATGDETDRFVCLNDCLKEIGYSGNGSALVVIEDYTKGKVYRYNNYGDNAWYECGRTEGFA